MNKIEKMPYEIFPVELVFSDELDAGERVTGATTACINVATGADTKADIVVGSSNDDTTVTTTIKGGSDGEIHKLTVLCSTDYSNNFEMELLIAIKSETPHNFRKQPNEKFSVLADFTDEIESGDSISTVTITALKVSDGTDATADVIDGSLLTTPKVSVKLKGGTSAEVYHISVKVVSAGGYKYQMDMIMSVKEE